MQLALTMELLGRPMRHWAGIPLCVMLWASPTLLCAQATLRTDDGLQLRWADDGTMDDIVVGDRRIPLTGKAGVFIRDENARSGWIPAVGAATRRADGAVRSECNMATEQLRLDVRYTPRPGHVHAALEARDLSGRDRALTIAFRVPVGAQGCTWWRDLRRTTPVAEGQECVLLSSKSRAGARGWLSVYPFSALSKPGAFGLSIGVPADQPRDYVIGIDKEGRFFIEFYVGLTRDTKKFPSRATVEWIIYRHDPDWGFRDAVRRYYEFYPKHFRTRSPQAGAWLCGLTPSGIDTPENTRLLGFPPSKLFRYHLIFSGIKEETARKDEEFGLITVPFIIALAKLRYPADPSLDGSDALTLLNRVGTKGFKGRLQGFWRGKESVLSSMLWDAEGRPVLEGAELPRGPGLRALQFPVNPDPDLYAGTERHKATAARRLSGNIEKALANMPSMDGYYFDFVSTINRHLSHRREHFAWADFPATFARDTRAVVLHNRFGVHEFMRELRRRFEAPSGPLAGKLLWANGMKMFSGGAAFEAFLVDIVGFEWSLRPNWHDFLSFDFARVVAGRKPAIHTCNPRPPALGKRIKPEQEPMWYRRMVLLGIPPIVREAFISPEWMRKHAKFIRLYVPIANQLQSAGWHPVPHARAEGEGIWIERFGRPADGSLHFAVYNSTDKPARFTLEAESQPLEIHRTTAVTVRDLCTQSQVAPQWTNDRKRIMIPLDLEPYGLAVLHLGL